MYFKRTADFVLAILGLIIASPLLLFIIFVIKLGSKGPVFFTQKRVGIRKKYFTILKFRTMCVNTPKDAPTHLLANPGQYITKAGKILRRTSLDELPQLINILKGDMSVVGPRPALWNQYDLIAERDKYRNSKGETANDVRPGLTGWAQINGRDELPIDVKAGLDGEYIQRINLRTDVKCFFKTIVCVLKGSGVVEGGAPQDEAYSECMEDTN
jgi:O-antigen biosynthesis protein WbqP